MTENKYQQLSDLVYHHCWGYAFEKESSDEMLDTLRSYKDSDIEFRVELAYKIGNDIHIDGERFTKLARGLRKLLGTIRSLREEK